MGITSLFVRIIPFYPKGTGQTVQIGVNKMFKRISKLEGMTFEWFVALFSPTFGRRCEDCRS